MMARLRWSTYCKKRSSFDSMVKRLIGTKHPDRVLIIVGQANVNGVIKGTGSAPVRELIRYLTSRADVLFLDEYLSSQIQSCCLGMGSMNDLRFGLDLRNSKADGYEPAEGLITVDQVVEELNVSLEGYQMNDAKMNGSLDKFDVIDWEDGCHSDDDDVSDVEDGSLKNGGEHMDDTPMLEVAKAIPSSPMEIDAVPGEKTFPSVQEAAGRLRIAMNDTRAWENPDTGVIGRRKWKNKKDYSNV